jgi:hypothetical protein
VRTYSAFIMIVRKYMYLGHEANVVANIGQKIKQMQEKKYIFTFKRTRQPISMETISFVIYNVCNIIIRSISLFSRLRSCV